MKSEDILWVGFVKDVMGEVDPIQPGLTRDQFLDMFPGLKRMFNDYCNKKR